MEQAKEVFDELKDEGKVRFFGAQGNRMSTHKSMVESGLFDFAVTSFNLLQMDMAEYAPVLEEKDVTLFPIQPLDGGLLTDKRLNRDQLPGNDRFNKQRFDSKYSLLEQMVSEFEDEIGESSITNFALRFALSLQGVPSIITSMNTVNHVKGTLSAVEKPRFDSNILDRALKIWLKHGERHP